MYVLVPRKGQDSLVVRGSWASGRRMLAPSVPKRGKDVPVVTRGPRTQEGPSRPPLPRPRRGWAEPQPPPPGRTLRRVRVLRPRTRLERRPGSDTPTPTLTRTRLRATGGGGRGRAGGVVEGDPCHGPEELEEGREEHKFGGVPVPDPALPGTHPWGHCGGGSGGRARGAWTYFQTQTFHGWRTWYDTGLRSRTRSRSLIYLSSPYTPTPTPWPSDPPLPTSVPPGSWGSVVEGPGTSVGAITSPLRGREPGTRELYPDSECGPGSLGAGHGRPGGGGRTARQTSTLARRRPGTV